MAEILRLSDFVPPEFRLATKEDQRKYGEIILDFSYFKSSEFCDQRIENNPVRQSFSFSIKPFQFISTELCVLSVNLCELVTVCVCVIASGTSGER